MTLPIALVLGALLLAMLGFAFEIIAAEVVALTLLVVLVVIGVLPVEQAFLGFGSDTFILIFGLLVMSAALIRTGVVDLTARAVLSLAKASPNRLLFLILCVSALLSAFMSNTAATAFLLPVVFGVTRKLKEPASQYLLPLAFASILTSSVTLISTSTNIVVSDLMTRYNLAPIEMFELAPVGIPIAVTGLLYMWFIGRRLIPVRESEDESDPALKGLRPYLSEVVVTPGSPLVGKSIDASRISRDYELTILRIVRDKKQMVRVRPLTILRENDVLLVEGLRDDLLKIKDIAGLELKPDISPEFSENEDSELSLVECLVMPGSPLNGRTLKSINFRQRYNAQVLGIDRHGQRIHTKISETTLRVGDLLLIQGEPGSLQTLEVSNVARILTAVEPERTSTRLATYALIIFILSLGLATFKVLALPVAALAGAVCMFLVGCITPEEAYRRIEWKVLLLIGAMLAVGAAMETTGADTYLATLVVENLGALGPRGLLAGFFILAVALTQPMSNQAAAVVLVPIAIQTAIHLGVNPRPFAMMIAIAASCSYLTPLEPACLMVFGPGRYRFFDFVRVGAPLTLIIFVIANLMVPWVWPF